MDETSPSPAPSTPTPTIVQPTVQEQLDGMRNLVTILLATVICIAGSVSVYLYRQATMLSRQVSEGRRIAFEFETNSLPRINMFIGSLETFSKSNPDFAAVLARYPLQQAAPSAGAPSSIAPAAAQKPIAPVPAPKK
jgi:hypothetical protein